MDATGAHFLLQNLLDRARRSQEETFLTSMEVDALEILLHGTITNAPKAAKDPLPKPKPAFAGLSNIDITPSDIPPDTLLCVDFGTSFSKAFASIDNGDEFPELIDLAIGDAASPLTTPSEMMIDNDVVYFGTSAREQLEKTHASVDRLIDSFKQYITLGADVSHLKGIRLDNTKDPTQKFYQRDILVLYLGHLMHLVETALEKRGLPINVRRRFTHPAWKDGHRESNENEMRKMMAEAIVLARTLGDKISGSLDVNKARALLDCLGVLKDDDVPLKLIDVPVREATAAGAGGLLSSAAGNREPYLIVDIGAGTTDIAGCYCVTNPKWDKPRLFEVTGAADAIKSAGNILDDALVKMALGKTGLVSGSEEHRATAMFIRKDRRLYKEQVFNIGTVSILLPTDDTVNISLREFLDYDPVKTFSAKLKDLIEKSARALAGDDRTINLIATGGGARLPFIGQIAAAGVDNGGRHVSFKLKDAIPDEVRASNPDLIDPYPQIAVAVGGCLPTLPEQKANVTEALTQAPKRVMAPTYRS